MAVDLGQSELLESVLAQAWGNGGSALPWIELKRRYGTDEEVVTLCRIALFFPDCPDREAIEDILVGLPPPRRAISAG